MINYFYLIKRYSFLIQTPWLGVIETWSCTFVTFAPRDVSSVTKSASLRKLSAKIFVRKVVTKFGIQISCRCSIVNGIFVFNFCCCWCCCFGCCLVVVAGTGSEILESIQVSERRIIITSVMSSSRTFDEKKEISNNLSSYNRWAAPPPQVSSNEFNVWYSF